MFKLPCGKCKKDIAISAEVCPYCQSEFTPEEIKKRKSDARGGCIFVIAAIIALLLWIGSCSKDKVPDNAAVVTEEEKTGAETEAKKSETIELSDIQSNAVSYARAIILSTMSCEYSVDSVERQINKFAQGEVSLVDAYSTAKSNAESCRHDLQSLKEYHFDDLKDPEAKKIAKTALNHCVLATEHRIKAIRKIMEYMNGDGDLDSAADYKSGLAAGRGDYAACKLTLAGLAEYYKVPESEVGFLSFR